MSDESLVGQIIPDDLPDRFKSAAYPLLPHVGQIVEFYSTQWERLGPWAAIVSRVETVSEVGSPELVAKVDLTVARNSAIEPWRFIPDVPGLVVGVKPAYKAWWQYRS